MAKFAISLCVLLAACGACQAKLSMFSTLTNGFKETVAAATADKTSPSAVLSNLLSPLSSTADETVNAGSAVASGDESSLLSSATNGVSDGMDLATSVPGSTNGVASLLSGITNALLPVTNLESSNPLFSLVTAPTTTWITTAADQIKTQISTIMGVMESSLKVAESTEIAAMDSITSSLGQLGNVIDSLTNSSMNVDSCISVASGITEMAGTAMINATTCTRKIVETMESDFNRAITVMSVFVESLSSLAKEIKACAKVGLFPMLPCVTKVSGTTGVQCAKGFGSTLSEVTRITTKIANVQNELAICGIKAAQEQVQKRILSVTVEVAQCVVEMGQAGLSGASETAAKAVETAKKVLSTISG